MHRPDPLNILISWAYWKQVDWDLIRRKQKEMNLRIFLDCGANTLLTSGGKKQFPLKDYCDWIKEYEDIFWGYLQLDVIYDGVKTRRNYDYMKEQGLNPIPIFTIGSKMEDLNYFWSQSDLVAFGGCKEIRNRLVYGEAIVKLARQRNKHVHILGMNDFKLINIWRPYSCDSISWFSTQMYGNVSYLEDDCLKTYHRSKGSIPEGLISAMKIYGFDLKALYDEKCWRSHKGTVYMQQLSACIWVRLMRGFYNRGINVWLVAGDKNSINHALDAYERDYTVYP